MVSDNKMKGGDAKLMEIARPRPFSLLSGLLSGCPKMQIHIKTTWNYFLPFRGTSTSKEPILTQMLASLCAPTVAFLNNLSFYEVSGLPQDKLLLYLGIPSMKVFSWSSSWPWRKLYTHLKSLSRCSGHRHDASETWDSIPNVHIKLLLLTKQFLLNKN